MQDEPTPIELTKAVADFLRNDITPLISGHQAFKLRVAINILDLVTRQLTREEGSDASEVERLRALLGMDGSVTETQPRARRAYRQGRGRSRNAGACGASVGDHDGQARGRSAELCVVQAGAGARRATRQSLAPVIARSPCDEAIQGVAAETVWIASLRSQ